MVAHCGFDLHFSDNEWCWASFHVFVSHLYIFFGKMSSSLAHFLIGSFIFLELSCMSCLYIFEINPLSVASFAIIFSQSEGCLFTLLIVSFAVQKLLSLGPICLCVLLFPLLWEVSHRGSCCDLCQRVFCLCFPLNWSHSVMSDSLQPHGLYPTWLLHPWDSPGSNTRMGCHFLLQGIFPTQESNLGLPHCR